MRKKIRFHLTVVYFLATLAVIAAITSIFFGGFFQTKKNLPEPEKTEQVDSLVAVLPDVVPDVIPDVVPDVTNSKPAPLPEDSEITEQEFANDGGRQPEEVPVVFSDITLIKNIYNLKNEKRTEYSIPAEKIDSVVASGKTPKISAEGLDCTDKPTVAVLLARSGKYKGGYGIDETYLIPLLNNGICPVFISYDYVNEQINAAKPSGLLLPGGAFAKLHRDSVTKYDGYPKHGQLKRNFAYLIAIDYAASHSLPTLGICAGHQQIADYLDGKLIGHVSKNDKKGVKHLNVSGAMHKISIEDDTLLHRIIGKKSIQTNSMHRSAVASSVKGDFIVSAHATDGVIEAVEPKEPWADFVLGVQWHPERMYQAGIYDGGINLMNAFCESVNRKFNK